MEIFEIIFIIAVNIWWFRATLKFERKSQFRGMNRYIQRTTRRQFVVIQSSIDRMFDKLTKESNAYFAQWHKEEKMLQEICDGTRSYDDLKTFKILNPYKNCDGTLSMNQIFRGTAPTEQPIPHVSK